MVSRERLREAIRAKGFRFKRESRKVQIYAKPDSGIRVTLRKIAMHREKMAKVTLRAVGYTDAEIQAFLDEHRRGGTR